MKAIAYIRGQEAELQKAEIKKYCIVNAIKLNKIFQDGKESGISDDRKGLKEMFKYISENKIDLVVIYKAEKLHRDIEKLIKIITDLKRKEIDLAIIENEKIEYLSNILEQLYY